MAKSKKVEEASVVEEKVKDKKKENKKDKTSVTSKKKDSSDFEKALFIQRFVAFILDIMIVSVVATFLSYPFLDLDSIQKLDNSSTQVMEDYISKKIDEKEYISESVSLSYEMARKRGVVSLFTIFLNILYFVVFQIKSNGQTLGKQLMKIKVISKDKKDLSMNQMIFRSLIINSILVDMVGFAILIFANQTTYFYGVGFLGMIQSILIVISGLMVMFSERRQGIHDFIAHTDVVRCDLVKEMETCEN